MRSKEARIYNCLCKSSRFSGLVCVSLWNLLNRISPTYISLNIYLISLFDLKHAFTRIERAAEATYINFWFFLTS